MVQNALYLVQWSMLQADTKIEKKQIPCSQKNRFNMTLTLCAHINNFVLITISTKVF